MMALVVGGGALVVGFLAGTYTQFHYGCFQCVQRRLDQVLSSPADLEKEGSGS